MASAIFFLDLKGKVCRHEEREIRGRKNNYCSRFMSKGEKKVSYDSWNYADPCSEFRQTLLCRNYRGDIPMSAVEKFPVLLSEAEEESSAVPPCFSHEGINVRPATPNPTRCLLFQLLTRTCVAVPLHSSQ